MSALLSAADRHTLEGQVEVVLNEIPVWKEKQADYEKILGNMIEGGTASDEAVDNMITNVESARGHVQSKEMHLDYLLQRLSGDA